MTASLQVPPKYKVLRGWVVCHNASMKVNAEEYRKIDFGWTRTEPVWKLLERIGIEIVDSKSVMIIPVGNGNLEIRWGSE